MTVATDLTRITLLTPSESTSCADEVHRLREHWTPRHPELPFFTLGTASYLDGRDGPEAYGERISVTNPILEESFGHLLERVAQTLSDHLGSPCRYVEDLGRPGFHVYLSDPAFEEAGRPHYDLQFETIDWEGRNVDLENQLSFTLALRLPEAGGGLRVWNVDYRRLRRTFPEMRREMLRENREPTLHAYHVGELVAHPGYLLHQIAPMPDMGPDDQRITLQGHAVYGEDAWILYW